MSRQEHDNRTRSVRIKIIRNLPWILAGIVILFTFVMSSQGAAESHSHSRRLAAWFVRLFRSDMPWLSDGRQQIIVNFLDGALRKTAHIFTFYLLTLFAMLGLRGRTSNKPLIFASASLFTLIVACVDEFHQMYSYGRNASTVDVLIDMAGAGAALVTVLLGALLNKCFRWFSGTWPTE